jgi:HD-GYP domain-containing protein (c-di-GMP phosphodiesterase class II)
VTQDWSGAATLGNLAFSDLRGWVPARVPAITRVEALAAFSGAFDLAESHEPGHAAQVTYLGLLVADRLGLDEVQRNVIREAGLLHDSGIAVRAPMADLDERVGHAAASAWVGAKFGLSTYAQRVIRAVHERWDGSGRPLGLGAEQLPIEALALSAAHTLCDEVYGIPNTLLARARVQRLTVSAFVNTAGPEVGRVIHELLRDDETWIALGQPLVSLRSLPQTEAESSPELFLAAAEAMGDVVDACAREPGRARAVAALAVALGRQAGMPEPDLQALRVAALLLDVGLLGVPRKITDKPAILSVDEMETMQRHASWSARILEGVPGMDDVARWVAAHHERIDGRGYPEMLTGDDIPLAARILAVADAYAALTAERPYRTAFTAESALDVIRSSAGTQFDAGVVQQLPDALAALDAEAAA